PRLVPAPPLPGPRGGVLRVGQGRLRPPEAIATAARMRAREQVQREIRRRIGAEERRFKEACDRLFRWVGETLDGATIGAKADQLRPPPAERTDARTARCRVGEATSHRS